MAKMEMPEEATDTGPDKESAAEDALPGDSFSEQISKLLPKDKELLDKLVARFNQK